MNRAVNPVPVTIALMNRKRMHAREFGKTPAYWVMTSQKKDELKLECSMSPSFDVMNPGYTKAFGLPITVIEDGPLELKCKEDLDGR